LALISARLSMGPRLLPRRCGAAPLALIAALVAPAAARPAQADHAPAAAPALHDVIRQAQRKIVKIYGAGGVRGLEAYQTGLLISPQGHVLTVFSYVLDTDDLTVVLDDGRRYAAK